MLETTRVIFRNCITLILLSSSSDCSSKRSNHDCLVSPTCQPHIRTSFLFVSPSSHKHSCWITVFIEKVVSQTVHGKLTCQWFKIMQRIGIFLFALLILTVVGLGGNKPDYFRINWLIWSICCYPCGCCIRCLWLFGFHYPWDTQRLVLVGRLLREVWSRSKADQPRLLMIGEGGVEKGLGMMPSAEPVKFSGVIAILC